MIYGVFNSKGIMQMYGSDKSELRKYLAFADIRELTQQEFEQEMIKSKSHG